MIDRWWPAVLGAVVVLSVVFQGLFYPDQTLLAAFLVTLLALWWLGRRGWKLELEWADIAITTLGVLAVLSYTWAANRENAVVEAALWASAALVYVMARRSGEGTRIIGGILVGGAGLLVIGLGEDLGVLHIAQWYLVGRLTFGLQYPDSAGALAFALGFLALWQSESTADHRWRAVLVALATAFWMDAFMTVSRGAFLAVLPAGLIGVLLTRRVEMGRAWRLVGTALLGGLIGTALSLKANGTIGLVAALVVGGGLELLAAQTRLSARNASVLAIAVVVLAAAFVASRASRPVTLSPANPFDMALSASTKSASVTLRGPGVVSLAYVAENAYGTPTTVLTRTLTLPAGSTLARIPLTGAPAGATTNMLEITLEKGNGALIGASPSSPLLLMARVLPYSVYNRFATLGPSDLSVWQRLLFIGDSLKLWAQRPILGWGGGGWSSAYRSVETFGYTALETHSSLTDIMTSYGTIGGLLFVAFWWLALAGAARDLRERPGAGLAIAGVLALLLHSLIDFDFNFTSLVLLATLLTGALQSRTPRAAWVPARWIPAAAVILLAAMAGTAYAGNQDVSAGQVAQSQGNSPAAQTAFLGATTWAPYDPEAWLGLAETQKSAAVAVSASQMAASDAPDDPSVLINLASLTVQAGDYALASDYGQTSVGLAPVWAPAYQAQGNVLLTEAVNADLVKGKGPAAHALLLQAASLLDRYDHVFRSEAAFPTSVNTGPTSRFLLTDGEVASLLGNVSLAESDLTSGTVTSSSAGDLAAAWLYALGGVYAGQVNDMGSLKNTWSSGSGALTLNQVASIQSAIAAMKKVDAAVGAGSK